MPQQERTRWLVIIADLTRAKIWLDAFRPLPPTAAEELRHRYDIRLTYHSTAIEGNTLTQSEVQFVLEKGITIGGKPLIDHLEVIGHREALDFVRELADSASPISEREIREIHALVMKGQGAAGQNGEIGGYRSLDVRASGTEFVYPSHLHVPELMAEFVAWLASSEEMHPVERAAEGHLRFVTVHPFRDGNGRVGRLLMNLLLLRAGYPIAVLPVERRPEYIDSLVEAQGGNTSRRLTTLVADAVEESLRDTLTLLRNMAEFGSRPEASEIAAWLDPRPV